MDLKFLKRAWHKKTCKVYELNIIFNNRAELLKFKPNDKLKIWFKVESKQYQNKWYTDAYLMHFELPDIKAEPKSYMNTKILFENKGEDF